MQAFAPVASSVARSCRVPLGVRSASAEAQSVAPVVAAQALAAFVAVQRSMAPAQAGLSRGAAVSGFGRQSNPAPSPAFTPNPAFHPTGYSGLRPLPPSGEFERWAS